MKTTEVLQAENTELTAMLIAMVEYYDHDLSESGYDGPGGSPAKAARELLAKLHAPSPSPGMAQRPNREPAPLTDREARLLAALKALYDNMPAPSTRKLTGPWEDAHRLIREMEGRADAS
jgi:hypothetical protein